MEHLRASQLENYEDENFVDLTKRLREHATEVVERVKASPDEPPQNFKADSTAVIETRFFQPLPGPGDLYELRDEGLTLALGFTLVDQLWQTHSANHDLASRICRKTLGSLLHLVFQAVDTNYQCQLQPVLLIVFYIM